MCDGSGELRFGWACQGCANCEPIPQPRAESVRPETPDEREQRLAEIAATDPWRTAA